MEVSFAPLFSKSSQSTSMSSEKDSLKIPVKRGIKTGTKITVTKTATDWYDVCEKFRMAEKNSETKICKSDFLRGPVSGPKFSGTLSEQQSFGQYLVKFDKGTLKPVDVKRTRVRKYGEIEKKLILYIELQEKYYKRDKCGLSWLLLSKKSQEFATSLGITDFKASAGWIQKCLRRANKVSINLHGEAFDLDEDKRKETMIKWCRDFHKTLEEKEVGPRNVYNADQTGLFYQKMPTRIYVSEENKKSYAGTKQMKDKTRVTLMVCTAADGTKVPLAMIGKSKRPKCFRLTNREASYGLHKPG